MAYPLSHNQSALVIRKPFSFERPILWRSHSIIDLNEVDKYRPENYSSKCYPEINKYDNNTYERFCRKFYRNSPSIRRHHFGVTRADPYYWSSYPSSNYSRYYDLLNNNNDIEKFTYRPRKYDYYSFSNVLSLPSKTYLHSSDYDRSSKLTSSYLEERQWPTMSYWDRRIANRMNLSRNRSYLGLTDRLCYGLYPGIRISYRY